MPPPKKSCRSYSQLAATPPIDFEKVRLPGKSFVCVKATEGLPGTEDADMGTNVVGAKANGLLVGVYHLAHPEKPNPSAIAEAESFLNYAQQYTGAGYLPPTLDLEQKFADQFFLSNQDLTISAAKHALSSWLNWVWYATAVAWLSGRRAQRPVGRPESSFHPSAPPVS
jgi:hypothetical protein